MIISETPFPGVKIIKCEKDQDLFIDERGQLEIAVKAERFKEAGLPTEWAQQNVSQTYMGVIRGLHIQKNNPQGKLLKCLAGTVQDVWVDLRRDSPTFKQWGTYQLNMAEPESLYLPPGLAHGFLTLTTFSVMHYLCTTPHDKASDSGIRYNDPQLNVLWAVEDGISPIVSAKDMNLPSLDEYLESLG